MFRLERVISPWHVG